MLTRRQLLIAAAVSPIAQFCRTEPGYKIDHTRGIVAFLNSKPFNPACWTAIRRVMDTMSVERRYALPPGTLG